jgi:hypothetical protein
LFPVIIGGDRWAHFVAVGVAFVFPVIFGFRYVVINFRGADLLPDLVKAVGPGEGCSACWGCRFQTGGRCPGKIAGNRFAKPRTLGCSR